MNLNWGCGPEVVQGWIASDRDPYPGLDHHGDLLAGLPWPDETFDRIVTNHALQMIAIPDMHDALSELRRVLVDGGVLRILVPDLLKAVEAYMMGDAAHFLVDDRIAVDVASKLAVYLTQSSSTRTLFTEDLLCRWLRLAGFKNCTICPPGITHLDDEIITSLDSRPGESLIVEARR